MITDAPTRRFSAANMNWPADSILPSTINTLSVPIAESILRRRLISREYVSLEEQVALRRTSFLSSTALILHFGVLLTQEQGKVFNIFRQIDFILFLQVYDGNIRIQVLDFFNTDDVYQEKPNEVPLRQLRHEVIYTFSLDDHIFGGDYCKITIRGQVWLRTPFGWERCQQRSFRRLSRFLKATDPERSTFRLVR
jgi:hypothetical protein